MTDAPVHIPKWRQTVAERGVTLTELAAAMETPLWTIYSYAQGKRRPSPEWEERAETTARSLGSAPGSAA